MKILKYGEFIKRFQNYPGCTGLTGIRNREIQLLVSLGTTWQDGYIDAYIDELRKVVFKKVMRMYV